MKVYLLENIGQANALKNAKYKGEKRFNPRQDADGNWIISEIERNEYLEIPESVGNKPFKFIKKLNSIDWNPPPSEPLT